MNYTQIAETLISEGFNPLPLRADKSPALPSGHPYLYEKMDNLALFDNCDMIGVACGKISGNLECIDFDAHKGQNIREVFKKFSSDVMVNTLIKSGQVAVYETPSKGYHIIYRWERSEQKQNLAYWADRELMIETRAQGQYIAVHPSPGYKLLSKIDLIKLSVIDQNQRAYLIDLAKSFNQATVAVESTHRGGTWGESWSKSTIFGRYNIEAADEAKELLTAAGWSYQHSRYDGVEYWTRPGKDKGTSATFGRHKNMFYVFSGNALPFQSEIAYSPVDILIKLKFNGDQQRAKHYLAEKYQVKQPEPEETPKPEFPIDVFPQDIQLFINEMNRTLNYNRDFLSISVMYTISVLNGNRHKLRVKNGWIAPTVFWFVAVGEPGTMKSHPISTVIAPLNQIDKESKRIYDEEFREWEANDSKGKKPRFNQLLIGDYTLEALHEVHSYNRRGIGMYKDEIIGFLNDMNKYRKGSDEQFWLESFNNKSYTVNRVSKEPIRIDDININIIGSIQPLLLSGVAKQYAGNGLVDRFLYTAAEDDIFPMCTDDISPEWFQWWEDTCKYIHRQCPYQDETSTIVLPMPDETLQEMIRADLRFVQMQISDEETFEIKNYLSKMKTYLPRFALLLGLMDFFMNDYPELTITPCHMRNAERICHYFIQSARNVFSDADKSEEITTIKKTLTAMTKAEKVLMLHQKGYKQKDIAKELKTSKSYVSRVLKS